MTMVNVIFSRLILITLLVLCFETSAVSGEPAATVTIYRFGQALEAASGVLPQIYVDGLINEDTLALLKGELVAHEIVAGTVYLNSPGGDLLAGIRLGREIRQRGLSTGVAVRGVDYGSQKPGKCLSSCVLAYVGGYYRFGDKDTTIGVHRFSKPGSTNYDLDLAQIISANITSYLKEMDVDTELFDRMTRAGKDQILILAYEDAKKLRVINNGILPASWNLENIDGDIYLKGQQETLIGTGKFMLACGKQGKVFVMIAYDAGERASNIASYSTHYSIRADGTFLRVDELMFPPQVNNNHLFATFLPSPSQLKRIADANALGFAFHPPNPDIFYGFLVDAREAKPKIVHFIKHCSTRAIEP